MKIIKYNCSLDRNVQNFQTYEGYLQVIDDQLIITNKKPLDNPKYKHDDSRILETNPDFHNISEDDQSEEENYGLNFQMSDMEKKGFENEKDLKNELKSDQFKL